MRKCADVVVRMKEKGSYGCGGNFFLRLVGCTAVLTRAVDTDSRSNHFYEGDVHHIPPDAS